MPSMYDYAGLDDPEEFFCSSALDPTIPEPSSTLIAGAKYDPAVPLGNSIRQEDIAFSLDAVVAELSHQQVIY
jgi:exonuclease I